MARAIVFAGCAVDLRLFVHEKSEQIGVIAAQTPVPAHQSDLLVFLDTIFLPLRSMVIDAARRITDPLLRQQISQGATLTVSSGVYDSSRAWID